MTAVGVPGRLVTDVTERVLAARDRSGVAAATDIACNSVYTVERVLASYGRAATVAAPGVDETVFRPGAGRPGLPYVMSVGGLEPFKNHHLVLEALGRIDAEHRPEMVLVYERCDGQYRTHLLRRAEQLRVVVTERREIDDAELARSYSGAAATVLAAQLEPLGLAALESIACGTPVVAVHEAGYRETVTHGVNGLLVPRSVDALAGAMASVVSGEATLADRSTLPATILPRWSSEASAERQLRLLRRTARG